MVIECDIEFCYVSGFGLVMVNLDKGIINFYVFSDIIIDVFMLVMFWILG